MWKGFWDVWLEKKCKCRSAKETEGMYEQTWPMVIVWNNSGKLVNKKSSFSKQTCKQTKFLAKGSFFNQPAKLKINIFDQLFSSLYSMMTNQIFTTFLPLELNLTNLLSCSSLVWKQHWHVQHVWSILKNFFHINKVKLWQKTKFGWMKQCTANHNQVDVHSCMLKNAEPSTSRLSATSNYSFGFKVRGLKFCLLTPYINAQAYAALASIA